MNLLNSIIRPIYAQAEGNAGSSGFSGTSTDLGISQPDYAVSSIGTLIGGLVTASIVVGALAAFMYLVLGGFQWITAGGDKGKTDEAQKKITNAIVGLVIIVAAWAIISVVTQFLGIGDISNLTLPSIE